MNIRFIAKAAIQKSDGSVEMAHGSLTIKDATDVVILSSIAKSYNGFDKEPGKEGKDDNEFIIKYKEEAVNYEFKGEESKKFNF